MSNIHSSTLKSILCTCMLFACGVQEQKIDNEVIRINIDPEVKYQIVHNFGASDAWSGQFVGSWPEHKKKKMAEWLFSTELDSAGSPKGIGLSAWRFNIGAGSKEQGLKSGIKDSWRRAPNTLKISRDDYSSIASQQWLLSAANSYQVNDLIAFVNSPPIELTRNGLAYADEMLGSNLKASGHAEFAKRLVDFLIIEEELGIKFDYISPFNEPQWDWKDGGQEGSPWLNSEISSISKLLNDELIRRNLSTEIEITEAATLRFLYESNMTHSNSDNQLYDFFNRQSELFIGDLQKIAKKIAGHSYYTTWPNDTIISVRAKLQETMRAYPNVEFWMTEYCLLEKNEEIKGSGKDLGMEAAMYMSKVIWADLTIANASAWQWWLAISPYNYKDGLIYIDKNEADGNYTDSKLLWTLGNFSRFVRPGSVRIENTISEIDRLNDQVLSVSFLNPDFLSITTIVINQSQSQQIVLFDSPKTNLTTEMYVTSEKENLSFVGQFKAEEIITIPARSISTFVQQ